MNNGTIIGLIISPIILLIVVGVIFWRINILKKRGKEEVEFLNNHASNSLLRNEYAKLIEKSYINSDSKVINSMTGEYDLYLRPIKESIVLEERRKRKKKPMSNYKLSTLIFDNPNEKKYKTMLNKRKSNRNRLREWKSQKGGTVNA